MLNPYIASFTGEPALVAAHMQEHFESCLNALATHPMAADIAKARAESHDDFWPEPGSWMAQIKPYVIKDGILLIPVKGVLLHDFPYQFFGLATGYTYIQKAFERGMADDTVRGIALVIDSPGGHTAGNCDLADKMYSYRGQKPVRAFAAEHAYSAAYAIASAADTITVARTGGVGSIGVVTMHVDRSKATKDAGYKITFIHAGKHKVDGNPFEPLPDDVKARIQSKIDALYDVFVATVARNRGLDESAVRETEALTFGSAEALSKKLADEIGPLDDGLAAFAANLNPNQGETIMSKAEDKKEAIDQATVDVARAEGVAEGTAQGTAAGAKAERERIQGIMALDEAKNRREAAFNIALESNMTVDQAKGLLAKLPEDQPQGKTGSKELFEAAMNGSEHPNLGAGAGPGELSAADQILADYRSAGGAVVKTN